MQFSDEPSYVTEMEWLATYYHARGMKDKAEEILKSIQLHRTASDDENVLEMFKEDEERRA